MLSVNHDKIWNRLSQLVLALCACAIFLTFKHYGISWDEEIQSQYGQAVFDYYNSGFADHRYNQLYNLYLYGGMFDGLAAFFDAYTPIRIYATRHLLNALIGLLGLWGAWRLGRLIGGRQVGFVTLILLVLTPMYYGHMFNNPKDIPFAVGVVWSLYYMTKTLRIFPKIRWKTIFMLGFVLGLTLGIRVGGVMLLGYWGLMLGLMVITNKQNRCTNITRTLYLIIPVAIISYVVMLFCWPWAQESPIINPIKAFIQFSNFPQDVEVLLNGITYRSTELPWYYVPVYLGVQLPLAQLVLIVFGLALLPIIFRYLPSRAHSYALGIILLTVFIPLLFAVTRHPALYDAVRHFIFTLPLLCLLAALAFRQLIKIARSVIGKIPAYSIFLVLSVVIVSFEVSAMVRLHPYEYIYINPIEGGVKGAFGHYELDYWGSSFKEAAEKLQEYVNREGGVPPGKIYRIAICGPWSSATIYLPPDYQPVVANEPAEFFLATTRWMCQGMRPGKEIITVRRMGAPLSVLKDLRGLPDYKPE